MEVSSSTDSSVSQVDTLKKANNTQEQQALKVSEEANEQTQETITQENQETVSQADITRKTGVGSNLNVTG